MNRNIKFRVWNGKKYIIEPRLSVSLLNFPYLFEIAGFGNQIQQFTGLKDKNGKEIYEGDILRVRGYDNWLDNIGFYYNFEVKYNLSESGESDISGFYYIPKDREIIGNIFENPELLK